MEHDEINNLLLSEDNENEVLSKFVRELENMLELIVYLIHITKINH